MLLLLCYQIRWRKQQLLFSMDHGRRETSDECHDFAVDYSFGWAGSKPHQVSFVNGPMQPWNRAYWIAFAALDGPTRCTWRGHHQYSAQEFSKCMCVCVHNCLVPEWHLIIVPSQHNNKHKIQLTLQVPLNHQNYNHDETNNLQSAVTDGGGLSAAVHNSAGAGKCLQLLFQRQTGFKIKGVHSRTALLLLQQCLK